MSAERLASPRRRCVPIIASRVTRFEVIHYVGAPMSDFRERALVAHGVRVELSYQDDGRTLKVFLSKREDDQ